MNSSAARPHVVPFAGHMMDVAARAVARFPVLAEGVVAAAIAAALDDCDASAGVGALASGADILFAEALQARGGELHVILPLNVEEFLAESVRPAGGDWEARFHRLRERATTFTVCGDDYLAGSGSPFMLAALLFDGVARTLARRRGWSTRSLAVWDGLAGDGLGGTASFVGHAVARGREVRAIDPRSGKTYTPDHSAVAAAQRHTWSKFSVGPQEVEHRLVAFLFADARGFGSLRETSFPAFLRAVMRVVSESIPPDRLALNTWGDGIFFASESPAACAEMALRLLEGAAAIDPAAAELPGPVTFRVGLHAGPAFFTPRDPVTGAANAYGRDVSLAARIEPIAAPGEAWASETFVWLAESLGCDGIAFEKLGLRALAKGAGEMVLYRVRRG